MERKREERLGSFPDDGNEETSSNGNTAIVKRRTAKITRRRVPTVDVRAAVHPLLSAEHNQSNTTTDCYSTIETISMHSLDVLANYYTSDGPTQGLSRWRENEHNKIKQEGSTSLQHCSVSRQSLQSKESSCNRLYSSRLNSRLSKRREQYSFKHSDDDDINDHLRHYSSHCSFSYLVLSSRKKELLHEVPEQSDSTQEATRENSSTYRSGGVVHNKPTTIEKHRSVPASYTRMPESVTPPKHRLHTLASRLGIEESIHEPALLHLPKPTTPSISKRKAMDIVTESLVVTGGRESKESKLVDVTDKKQLISRQQQRGRQFPSLTKPIKKGNPSTISVSKYLNINNKGGNMREQVAADVTNSEEENEEEEEAVTEKYSLAVGSDSNDPWPEPYPIDLMADSSIKKDIVIRRAADSLGLHSHKWAKDFIERGFLNGRVSRKLYYNYSRPSTRGSDGSDTTDTKTSHKEKKEDIVRSASTAKGEKKKAESIAEKLQKLESVYMNTTTSSILKTRTGTSATSKRKIKSNCGNSRPQTQSNTYKPLYDEGMKERMRSNVQKWTLKGEKWQTPLPIHI